MSSSEITNLIAQRLKREEKLDARFCLTNAENIKQKVVNQTFSPSNKIFLSHSIIKISHLTRKTRACAASSVQPKFCGRQPICLHLCNDCAHKLNFLSFAFPANRENQNNWLRIFHAFTCPLLLFFFWIILTQTCQGDLSVSLILNNSVYKHKFFHPTLYSM